MRQPADSGCRPVGTDAAGSLRALGCAAGASEQHLVAHPRLQRWRRRFGLAGQRRALARRRARPRPDTSGGAASRIDKRNRGGSRTLDPPIRCVDRPRRQAYALDRKQPGLRWSHMTRRSPVLLLRLWIPPLLAVAALLG